MGIFKPTVDTRQPTSPATPFAEDFLKILSGELSKGFGTGVGPLQREAGTAARQFVSSGGGSFPLSELFANLEAVQNRRVGEQAADLREGFGALGSRFGTPLAGAESRFRRDTERDFAATLGELSRQEFGAQQQRMLQGIQLLNQIGLGSIAPFLDIAKLGILPEAFVVGDSPFSQVTQGALGAAAVQKAF